MNTSGDLGARASAAVILAMAVSGAMTARAAAQGTAARDSAAAHRAASPQARALLVGVGRYPILKQDLQARGDLARAAMLELRGPVHDVARMHDVLGDTLEIPADRIRTLSGWPDEASDRPTRANILAALDDLAAAAGPDELVVVYLAGHGTRVPDRDGDEVDGWDEVFLPADVSRWDDEAAEVPGAILDDEIGQRIAAIREAGARVWLVVDACFSGTLMRSGVGGRGSGQERFLPEAVVGIPTGGAVAGAQDAAAGSDSPPDADAPDADAPDADAPAADTSDAAETDADAGRPGRRDSVLEALGSGVTAFYAVDARSEAIERAVRDGDEARHHGMFTWHLTHALARTGPGASFDELYQQLVSSMVAAGFAHRRPTMEGEADVAILDGAAAGMRLRVGLEKGRPTVRGGLLHGLRPGDELEVYAAGHRGDPDHRLGRVQLVETGPLRSTARSVVERGLPPSALPDGGDTLPAELSSRHDVRRDRLAVAVVGSGEHGALFRPRTWGPDDREVFDRRAVLVDDPAAAELLVEARPDGSGILTVGRDPAAPRFGFGTGDLATWIYRVHRARTLTALADDPVMRRLPEGLEVRIEVEDDGSWTALRPGRTLAPDTRLRIHCRNRGPRGDWDVYVFLITAEFEMKCLLPEYAGQNPIRRDAVRPTVSDGLRFTDAPLGDEQFLVLVVPSGSDRLEVLAEDPARLDETTRGSGVRGLLHDLVAAPRDLVMRGVSSRDDEVAAMRLIPYHLDWPRVPLRAPFADRILDTEPTGEGGAGDLGSAWRLGDRSAWLGGEAAAELGLNALWTRGRGFSTLMVDVDRDSTLESTATAKELSDAVAGRGAGGALDFELAIRWAPDAWSVWYDRPGVGPDGGAFDAVRIDTDGDPASERARLLVGDAWVADDTPYASCLSLSELGADYDADEPSPDWIRVAAALRRLLGP